MRGFQRSQEKHKVLVYAYEITLHPLVGNIVAHVIK